MLKLVATNIGDERAGEYLYNRCRNEKGTWGKFNARFILLSNESKLETHINVAELFNRLIDH